MSRVEKNKNLNNNTDLNGSSLKISIVVSQWNSQITDSLYKASFSKLKKLGVKTENINRINVSGSFELIFGCKAAIKGNPNSIIAIGSLIKGETKHFDFISNAVTNGIKDLNILFDIPIIFSVLTDNNIDQAINRSGGKHGNKGEEAAIAAVEMALLNNKKV
ncbi:MAG: 6,7-dimethyl-8-ribityllumazine synthase [Flavobacteriaceae bacterium]|nr:6,7-dimethyl-8-ribityllumazine synthase [Flavobacteriaceae bacterium]|tara:strand:- start:2181 stop:2666 length:486 start_codon:yes stop_codon:yes gene_type:complete